MAAKIISASAGAYGLSPIDLIQVIGYLDELILLPCIVWLAMKFIPKDVKDACRRNAIEWLQTHQGNPIHRRGILLVVAVCLICLAVFYQWLAEPLITA